MRVAIAGAGNVGRSIARELIGNGHQVLLIDRDPASIKPSSVPEAEWLLADACELDSLGEAHLESCDVSIAATGDDKANLVHSLLAKTEFGVPRTVGRVNHPGNEWLFDEVWGVDVAVSTPRLMSALVEEAVTVGDLVRLFTFRRGTSNLVEMTLPDSSPAVGRRIGDLSWPGGAVLVAIMRDGRGLAPDRDGALEIGDELLFIVEREYEVALAKVLSPHGEVRTVTGEVVKPVENSTATGVAAAQPAPDVVPDQVPATALEDEGEWIPAEEWRPTRPVEPTSDERDEPYDPDADTRQSGDDGDIGGDPDDDLPEPTPVSKAARDAQEPDVPID